MNLTAAEKAFITAWAQEKACGKHDGPAGRLFPKRLHPGYIHRRMGALVAMLARGENRGQNDIINGEEPENVIWPWSTLEEWEARCQEAREIDAVVNDTQQKQQQALDRE